MARLIHLLMALPASVLSVYQGAGVLQSNPPTWTITLFSSTTCASGSQSAQHAIKHLYTDSNCVEIETGAHLWHVALVVRRVYPSCFHHPALLTSCALCLPCCCSSGPVVRVQKVLADSRLSQGRRDLLPVPHGQPDLQWHARKGGEAAPQGLVQVRPAWLHLHASALGLHTTTGFSILSPFGKARGTFAFLGISAPP